MFPTAAAAIAAAPPPVDGPLGLAIPDGTRPVDVPQALAALRAVLPGDPVAVVGLGLHRAMRPEELPSSPFPLLQHDPDDTVATAVIDGVPGGVARVLAGRSVLGVGVVELHQYAGFSGGHKAVSVGCGARATIGALHHRDRVCAPGVELGRLDGNPFRAVVDRLGEAAGCTWVLLQCAGGWVAGEPGAALTLAAASLDCWFDVPARHADAILLVTGRKAVNFYQASRAATYLGLSARPPLLPGATLWLDAACPEGLGDGAGERAFAQVLGRFPSPWDALLTGPAPVGGGTQRAIMLAMLLRRYRLVVCGVDEPATLTRVGLDARRERAVELAPAGALVVEDAFSRLPRLRA
jgi:hypothetical protein